MSPPIIPFRETLVPKPKVDMLNEVIGEDNSVTARRNFLLEEPLPPIEDGCVSITTANKHWTVVVRADPLPAQVTRALEESSDLLRSLHAALRDDTRASRLISPAAADGADSSASSAGHALADALSQALEATKLEGSEAGEEDSQAEGEEDSQAEGEEDSQAEAAAAATASAPSAVAAETSIADHESVSTTPHGPATEEARHARIEQAQALLTRLEAAWAREDGEDEDDIQSQPQLAQLIWECGPRHMGSNALICELAGVPALRSLFHAYLPHLRAPIEASAVNPHAAEIAKFANSLRVGFQLITHAGPLCEEPMMGVAFTVGVGGGVFLPFCSES